MNQIIELVKKTKVYDVAKKTPLTYIAEFSKQIKNKVYLKREDMQQIHSFKLRGAYQKISSLSKKEKKAGIIASSAGNHAQGVAFAAKKLNINSIIVMPASTPEIKVRAVKNLGSKVILHGDVYDEAFKHAKQLEKKYGYTFIHPFDDIEVIAGQATIAKEIIDTKRNIDYVFVPVGGGGLISGIGLYIKDISPKTKVIGIEPIDSQTLYQSLHNKQRTALKEVGGFADGVAVKLIGEHTFNIAKKIVDDIILVSNDEICAGIKDIYDNTRSIVEPSGALALAGAKKYCHEQNLKNKNIVAIVSGANVNFDRLRYIAERAELGEHKEAIFAVSINEKKGSFLKFCNSLKEYTITEFNYRYADKIKAHIFVGIELKQGVNEKNRIIEKLSKDYQLEDMSNNSIAKTHVRYMVGGRANVRNEEIYRFEFPERRGALLDFLIKIGSKWNITLFHYRNHGAAFGQVLVGFQTKNTKELELAFSELKYFYKNETSNNAYKFFL